REHRRRRARRADHRHRRPSLRHDPRERALGDVSAARSRPRQPLPAERRRACEDEPARLPDAAHHRVGCADGGELGARARPDARIAAARPARSAAARRAVVGTPAGGDTLTLMDRDAGSGLPCAPTVPVAPAPELVAALPMSFARRHLVLPFARIDGPVDVALADPTALAPLDDLRFLYRAAVRPLVVPAPALREAITRAYDAAA